MGSDLVVRGQDLVENPTPRVPVVLCLDTSGSMNGAPIAELQRGVNRFWESLRSDEVARYSAEVGVVTFGKGGVQLLADFRSVERQPDLALGAGGDTPMGQAVNKAVRILGNRKQQYKDMGVDFYQPWLVLMTDGYPTEDIEEAVGRVVEMVNSKALSVFAVGIGDQADMDTLGRFSPSRLPLRLRGLEFEKFFEWLSASVQRVSASTPGQSVPLDTDGIKGWAEV
ncbi:MAG: VWA domain-containing protein [Albidovulum sp.]|nr:VWA domain-containing protein [Albidovulum sp.]